MKRRYLRGQPVKEEPRARMIANISTMDGGWTRDKILGIISSDIDQINAKKKEVLTEVNRLTQEGLDFLDELFDQVCSSSSGQLLVKTPKVLRKKNLKRIETIPEDDLVEISNTPTKKILKKESEDQNDDIFIPPDAGRRSKREASKKAGDIIKQQQSLTLHSKMRRPSEDDEKSRNSKASSRESHTKRLRSTRSSDEEETKQPKKQVKQEPRSSSRSTRNKPSTASILDEDDIIQPKKLSTYKRKIDSIDTRSSKRSRSRESFEPDTKKANIVDETLENPSPDDTIEPSMYEDAIGKAVPIMNSTMKPSSIGNQTRIIAQANFGNETRIISSAASETLTNNYNTNEPMGRMMNVTVVLENLKKDETITISKTLKTRSTSGSTANLKAASEKVKEHNGSPFATPALIPKVTINKLKPLMELNSLITDDESSPERKLPREKKIQKKSKIEKVKEITAKRVTRSSLLSDDEVDLTPGRKVLGEMNGEKVKNGFKKNMLFSPYAKESVKKKIEAFEQAVLAAPVVEIESGMRLTRTKTRALAAASDNERASNASSISQKLARKSLAKAKQISRAKDAKVPEESKENLLNSVQKQTTNEKLLQKQQQRITPNSKIRPPMPSSVSRGLTTPNNQQSLANYSKPMTGSRTNIVTNVDSFIQAKNSAQKPNSNDKLMEDRKRKQQEEDAKKKREELLKSQMEEKKRRREEKERKNRLAREAKERQEYEKRLKAEKEKEDKAKLALQMQEKQKEEVEKKRQALLQRAQEKEERRRQEEELRLQRLREQEEMERQLAEQKRREQEAEKRRLMEVKAQQAAASEALKIKSQLLAAQSKKLGQAQNKLQQQQLTSYKIDSEPDSDSDDELRPKHEIPAWAKMNNRMKHLAMQEYIPMQAIRRLFDVKKCTPDLTELFHGIDKNRLKRTSSAIWKTPPRFSMMDAINN